MKKSHLLWKVLVVVMIISALMASVVACGGHDCEKDGHVDEDGNYICDVCGTVIRHTHVDANRDHKCDLCGETVNPCNLGNHVDANGDFMCDDCTVIYGSEGNWNDFLAELDKVVDSMGSMGQLNEMGGSLSAGIAFEQGDVAHDIDIALDFGLELREFEADEINLGSGNAFGVTISDNGTRIFGLWYVDNGSEADNYIFGQFGAKGAEGTEIIKFNAPSLAQTFNTFPINVDVDIAEKVTGVKDIDGSSIVGTIASILPLYKTTSGNTTTYEIKLTDFLFNKVNPPMTDDAYQLGSLLSTAIAGIPAINTLIQTIGLNSDLLTTLDSLLPGLALTVGFTSEGGQTTGASLGIKIAGETMSVPLYVKDGQVDGMIGDIFAAYVEDGEVVINNGKSFEDITLDVSLGYEFGSNSSNNDYPYTAKVQSSLSAAETDLKGEAVRNIGLLNVAVDTTLTLGIGEGAATDYPVQLAASIDPSALVEGNLLVDAYVLNEDGKGVYTDTNKNGVQDSNEPLQTVPAINFTAGVNAYDVVLSMIDNLYLKIGDLEVRLLEKTVNADGSVPTFRVNISGLSWIKNLLTGFGVDLSGVESLFDALSEGEMNIGSSSPLKSVVVGLLEGLLVKGFSYDKPADAVGVPPVTTGDNQQQEEEKEEVNIGEVLATVNDYLNMFQFAGTEDSLSLSTASENNGVISLPSKVVETGETNADGTPVTKQLYTQVSFDVTGSITRDAQDKINSLTLAFNDDLVIVGDDTVTTTISLDKPLKIGGENNLFSVQVTAVVVDEREIKTTTVSTDCPSGLYFDVNGNGKYDVGEQVSEDWNKSMNLTIGLDLNGIGYGVVPSVSEMQITADNFATLFSSNPNLAIAK